MAKPRSPAPPYPLTADEAAILATAQHRQAEDVGLPVGKLLGRLLWFRRRIQPKPQPDVGPLDTTVPFR
jgi:hypothetical protein